MSSGQTGRRILLVGASGQVGAQLLRILPPELTISTSRGIEHAGWRQLDLSTVSEVDAENLIGGCNIEVVYCVAGMTNVDACESASALAHRVNCEGPAILAIAAARHKARFVYFSTDYVFNGLTGPYTEDTPGDPICAYGRSKWRGELAVRDAHPAALVIRTTGVYGVDSAQRNFLYSLRKGLAGKQPFRAPVDQIATPTYNADLAAAAVALVESAAQGVFHVAGPDVVSRFEFARRAAVVMKVESTNLSAVATAELGQVAPRPLRAGLLCGKLAKYLPHFRMRGIEEGVSHWVRSGN